MKYLGILCRKPGKSVLCIVLTFLVVNASSVSLSSTKDAPLHVIEICNSDWAAGRQIVEYAAWDLTMMYPSTFLLTYLTHDEKLSDAHLRAKHISPEDAIPAVFINGKHAFYGRPSQGSGHHYHWRNAIRSFIKTFFNQDSPAREGVHIEDVSVHLTPQHLKQLEFKLVVSPEMERHDLENLNLQLFLVSSSYDSKMWPHYPHLEVVRQVVELEGLEMSEYSGRGYPLTWLMNGEGESFIVSKPFSIPQDEIDWAVVLMIESDHPRVIYSANRIMVHASEQQTREVLHKLSVFIDRTDIQVDWVSEKMYYLPQSLFEKPWIENSRTMVSIDCLQFLADVVYYDQEQQSLYLKHLSKRIDIAHTLGSSTATINGKVIDLPLPSALSPKVISHPHLPPLPCVPLRAFAEALEWEVHWNNETRAVSLKNQVT